MKMEVTVKMFDEHDNEIKTGYDQTLFVHFPLSELDPKANPFDPRNPVRFLYSFLGMAVSAFIDGPVFRHTIDPDNQHKHRTYSRSGEFMTAALCGRGGAESVPPQHLDPSVLGV